MLKKITYLALGTISIVSQSYAKNIKFEYIDKVKASLYCDNKDKNTLNAISVKAEGDTNERNKALLQMIKKESLNNKEENSTIHPSIFLHISNLVKEKNPKLFNEYCKHEVNEKKYNNQDLYEKMDNIAIKKINMTTIKDNNSDYGYYQNASLTRHNKIQFTYNSDYGISETTDKTERQQPTKQTISIFFNEPTPEQEKLIQSAIEKLQQIQDHQQIYSLIISAMNQSDKTEKEIKSKIKTSMPVTKKVKERNKETYEAIKKLIELDILSPQRMIIENQY